jgi:methyl-accepting chemotaxis protein
MKLSALRVRARLFLAFGGIAATTVIAAAVACMLFGQFRDLLGQVTGRSIPAVTASLELAAQTQSLAAAAPALLGAKDDAERTPRLDVLRQSLLAAGERIKRIQSSGADPAIVKALNAEMSALTSKVLELDTTVSERIGLSDAAAKKIAAVDAAHDQLLHLVAPAIEQARNEIEMASMSIGGDIKEVTGTLIKLAARQAPVSLTLSDMLAESNLVSALLHRGDAATSDGPLQTLSSQFTEAGNLLREQLDALDNLDPSIKLRDTVDALLALGNGQDNVFDLRHRELEATQKGESVLNEAHAVINELQENVNNLVKVVRKDTNSASDRLEATIKTGTIIVVAIAAAGVLAAVLIIWLYVGRNIVRRLTSLQRAMTQMAGGDLTAEVSGEDATDEVGEMARTLAVFKQSMVEAQRLATVQEVERQAKERRALALEALTGSFETKVGQLVQTLSSAAKQMQEAARSMTSTAAETNHQSTVVATASEETSTNVQTVATATEELASSISEIGRQVAHSAQIALRAVSDTKRTDETVQALADSAQKIGDIVNLINSIAGQTNLLALNATIEAARAGDAGKGFAVVAGEVKSLASQTAKATDEIAAQITRVQAATKQTVDAIREISVTIQEINQISTTIAAAVEQQGSATQEIARSVQQAARGTQEVSSNIVTVKQAAANTGSAASQVLGAAEQLSLEAQQLSGEVDHFLTEVKAA